MSACCTVSWGGTGCLAAVLACCITAPPAEHCSAPCACRSPLPPGLWPALGLMLLGCGMVIGSKAAAAAADIPKAASSLLPPLNSSAERQHGNATAPAKLAAAVATARQVSLWPQRAEEAWLCTAVFGEERGSWLCGRQADDIEPQGGGSDTQGGERQQAKKKKHHPHPHADSGLGMRDVVGICLSLLGAASLAAFMLIVQVGGGVGGRGVGVGGH